MSIQLLKILSGPNTGAEVELPEGEFVLGTGNDCDIILVDAAIATRHMRIEVTLSGVTVVPLEGTIVLEGETVPDGGAELPEFRVLTVGGTYLCMGPANEAWPHIPVPALIDACVLPEEKTTGLEEIVGEELEYDEQPNLLERFNLQQPAFMVAAAVLFIVVVSFVWTLIGTESPTPIMEARELLQANGYGKITVVQTKSGGLELQGVVNTDSSKLNLITLFEGFNPYPVLKVKSYEELAAELQDIIQKKAPSLAVSNVGGSKISITGYVQDPQELSKLRSELEPEITHYPTVRWEVTTWDDLKPELSRLVLAQGLEGKLSFAPEPEKIYYSGMLTKDEAKSWQAVQDELSDIFLAQLPFMSRENIDKKTESTPFKEMAKNSMTGTMKESGDMHAMHLTCNDIEYVDEGGGHEFIRIDGMEYMLGSLLPGGFRLQEISPAIVVLGKKDLTMYCQTGGN
ncbi:MAG: type III secretion system inner membrane ring subunit SctD [Desulfovibrionales bacterium]|nr:type III secretion system inner membrane ring subunit SctD [Desulfovibrionales bacterium]